jgi:hypothetical protein
MSNIGNATDEQEQSTGEDDTTHNEFGGSNQRAENATADQESDDEQ